MRIVLAVTFALAILAAAPASAQSVDAAKLQVAPVLADIERNLTDAEAIGMNLKDWKSRYASLEPRLAEYNRRMDEANAYCQGTFEHDEYVRRKAQCDATDSQLATLKAQLIPEHDNLETELKRLQQRETDRAAAMDKLEQRLTAALSGLSFACSLLSTAEFRAQCHPPSAPGPRTTAMVTQIDADIQGKKP